MALYTIKSETLTALGDAVREKTGELTREGYIDTETWRVEVSKGLIKSYYFPAGTRSAKIEKVSYSGHVVTTICDSNGQELRDENGNKYGNNFYLEEVTEIYVEDMDVCEFEVYHNGAWLNTTFVGEFKITSYDADGNVIQVPGIVKNTMTPAEMAEAIEGLPPTPPDEAFNLTGDCSYRFAENGWNWFIDKYGDKIKTKDITSAEHMFDTCTLTTIPFDINFKNTGGNILSYAFHYSKLREIPKITGKVLDIEDVFYACQMLREISAESVEGIDWSDLESQTSTSKGKRGSTFANCYSLRKFPMSFLAHGNPYVSYSNSIYYYLFNGCYALDEAVGVPVIHRNATWTSNAFNKTVENCGRLKRFTFETNEDGTPIKVDGWSKQTIDLSKTGWITYDSWVTSYNSGIKSGFLVNSDSTYASLKTTEDWFTAKADYSRYNKDSAVETINTLPDLSGGKGSNTIKFKGAAGAKTDEGAINTMTEAEIAVATAKGWTVTFA